MLQMVSSEMDTAIEARSIATSPLSSSSLSSPLCKIQKDKLLVIQWEHLNLYKFYPMALCSSWTIRCMLYPMSVVKSRLQLQRQNNEYNGMRDAFVKIIKHEGIGALYKVSFEGKKGRKFGLKW